MTLYTICLSRDITESAVVVVEAQNEAIAVADANLNNAALPLYSAIKKERDELYAALRKLSSECNGENLGTRQAPTWTTLCSVATLLHDTKQLERKPQAMAACTQEPVALTHACWLDRSLAIGAKAAAELRRLHEVEKQRDELLDIARQALALHPSWDAARTAIAHSIVV